jgi:MFS superfamily sulfate permease-like transporter
MYLQLDQAHGYRIFEKSYQLNEEFLVAMPDRMFGMFREVTTPDFSVLGQWIAWKWIMMFFIIGSLESLLSAKAVDLLDPWKRKTNMDRDVLAVGAANLVAAMIGGLPMISEIVRSKSNIDNGARTRFANMWHGVFLLLCVALIPTVLHRIPLAALAAMLVYTGTRLAHPNEFRNVYRIGREQLLIFVVTLVVVLATDLLIGVAAGVLLKMVIHLANGVPLRSFFKAYVEVEDVDEHTTRIIARESAVFSNWIPFRRQIEDIGLVQKRNLILDLSGAAMVDASVMEKLEEMQAEFQQNGLTLELRGLEDFRAFSPSSHSARIKALTPIRRITIVTDGLTAAELIPEMVKMGISGWTRIDCHGAGRSGLEGGLAAGADQVRLEVITVPEVCDCIIEYLRVRIMPVRHVTACVETVDVIRLSAFQPQGAANLHHVH